MILKDKTILIMGIRNKWSIAYGAAKAAYEQGAKLIFTFMGEENREKIEELVSEFKGFKAYTCDASKDEEIESLFKTIKNDYGKIDGILHSIAHANTEDLRNDFINTSKEGFAHANDVSAYSLVAVARIARDLEVLNENASITALTYYGSTKVLPGYNVMGVAKAALECSIRYLADNLGPMGVRVNAISAGPIKTLSAKGIKDFNSILSVVEEKAPLRRNVTTEEVGNAVTFLLSDMSRAITGQVIYADSGYNIMGL
ncbi:MAG TPA: enoyl-ACP reductase [Candidatus Scatovivens faecipullorum]|nr:enoyl-ACP reductase [Candidatus Scatovivens faecipullorum]